MWYIIRAIENLGCLLFLVFDFFFFAKATGNSFWSIKRRKKNIPKSKNHPNRRRETVCWSLSWIYFFFFSFIFHYTQLLLWFGHPTQKSKNELIQKKKTVTKTAERTKKRSRKNNDNLVPLLVVLVLCLFFEIRSWLWLLHYMIDVV